MTLLTLYFVLAIFVIVVFIAIVLVKRHGHTVETKAIRDDIAGFRQQWDTEHQALQDDVRDTKGWMRKLLDRFRFLKGGNDP